MSSAPVYGADTKWLSVRARPDPEAARRCSTRRASGRSPCSGPRSGADAGARRELPGWTAGDAGTETWLGIDFRSDALRAAG